MRGRPSTAPYSPREIDSGDQVPGRQIRRRVVDVEAEADGDARAVGPPPAGFSRLPALTVKHLPR
jgi:hypothetical protein